MKCSQSFQEGPYRGSWAMLLAPDEGEAPPVTSHGTLTGCTEKGTPLTTQSNLEKTTGKSRLKAILEDTRAVLLKAAKVMKNEKD